MSSIDSDFDLLQRFRDDDDADAFALLVSRHTALVYHACLRVLGRREPAEDATQETFHRLMLNPEKVRYSLPAWLHRVATHLAIDAARSDARRQRRERLYQKRIERRRGEQLSWAAVSAQLDEAITALPDAERNLLVEHYLRGRSQADLAREQGVSKATMCRRMEPHCEHCSGRWVGPRRVASPRCRA